VAVLFFSGRRRLQIAQTQKQAEGRARTPPETLARFIAETASEEGFSRKHTSRPSIYSSLS